MNLNELYGGFENIKENKEIYITRDRDYYDSHKDTAVYLTDEQTIGYKFGQLLAKSIPVILVDDLTFIEDFYKYTTKAKVGEDKEDILLYLFKKYVELSKEFDSLFYLFVSKDYSKQQLKTYFEEIKKITGISVKELKEYYDISGEKLYNEIKEKSLTKESVLEAIGENHNLTEISPAQVFINDKAYFLAYLPTQGESEYSPFLITDKKDIVSYTYDSLKTENLTVPTKYKKLKRIGKDAIMQLSPPGDMKRWTINSYKYSIKDWLEGKDSSDISPDKVFDTTRKVFEKYMFYPEDVYYDIQSLWVLHTYCYRLFSYCSYLFVNGTANSGKSRTMSILEKLAFNAIKGSHFSEAYVFRTIEMLSASILRDEAETLESNSLQKYELSVYKDGYVAGAKIGRCVGDDNIPQDFDIFSPKVFGNIAGLEIVLESRTIKQNLVTALGNYPAIDVGILEEETKELRNSYYILILKYWKEIKEIYSTLCVKNYDKLTNRHRDIFLPLLTMAKLIDKYKGSKLYNKVLAFAYALKEQKQDREQRESMHTRLLPHLYRYIKTTKPTVKDEHNWFSVGMFRTYLLSQEDFVDEIDSLKDNKITFELNKMGLSKREDRKSVWCNNKTMRVIKIDETALKEAFTRYGMVLPELEEIEADSDMSLSLE